MTPGKTTRSACCIIRKFPRDLRAADKKLSYAISNGYAKRDIKRIGTKRFLSEIKETIEGYY